VIRNMNPDPVTTLQKDDTPKLTQLIHDAIKPKTDFGQNGQDHSTQA
jgi:hypothetical protein